MIRDPSRWPNPLWKCAGLKPVVISFEGEAQSNIGAAEVQQIGSMEAERSNEVNSKFDEWRNDLISPFWEWVKLEK